MVEYKVYSDDEVAERVYEYLVLYITKNGFAPSRKEMSAWLGDSVYTVSKSLEMLQEQGLIEKTKRKPRAIKLLNYKLVKNNDIKN